MPEPIAFEDVRVQGELLTRLYANLNRLEETKYQPDHVFLTSEQSGNWDGDTEGRTILALVLDAQAAHRPARYLAEIMQRLTGKLNARGYFGIIYPDQVFCEQQMSGHGWTLRALCEVYAWQHDAAILGLIQRMLDNLVLPSTGFHREYPVAPTSRQGGGSHAGTVQAQVGHWILSSDTGCDFILLDGIVQAYQYLPSPQLRVVIDEMIARFLDIDLAAIKAQTHASLCALRGILRYVEMTGDARLLQAVIDRYELYRAVAMTENDENYNWFGRPEWTESCAVIDALLAAVGLWRLTGRNDFLADAHHIYYNALGVLQRYNGGFGCDSCSGANDSPYVEVAIDEAHWCCTMRGGEGLARMAQYTFFRRKAEIDEITLPFFHASSATLRLAHGEVRVRETTGYPFDGWVRLDVLDSTQASPVRLRLFAPEWTAHHALRLNGAPQPVRFEAGFAVLDAALQAGDGVDYSFDLVQAVRPTRNPASMQAAHAFTYGPLALGYAANDAEHAPRMIAADARLERIGHDTFKVSGSDILLTPVYHLLDPSVWQANGYRKQVLFRQA
jgi:hypothetical protein